ncbi:hypothetical protein PFISCL1PPCAC_13512, partial [Pristionchus fissidentatus]
GRPTMRIAFLFQLLEGLLLVGALYHLTMFPVHRCVSLQSSPKNLRECGVRALVTTGREGKLNLKKLNRAAQPVALSKHYATVCEPVPVGYLNFAATGQRHVSHTINALIACLLLITAHTLVQLVNLCFCPMWQVRGASVLSVLFHFLVLGLYYAAHYALLLERSAWNAEAKLGVEFPKNWDWTIVFTLSLAIVRSLQAMADKFLNRTHVDTVARSITLFDFSTNTCNGVAVPPQSARNTGTIKSRG